jgi:hypothetical protein
MTTGDPTERRAHVLEALRAAMAEEGLAPTLVQANPGDPASLVVPVLPDRVGRPQAVTFTPLPLDDEISQVELVQLHTVLPFSAAAEDGLVARAVVIVNRSVTVGHFGIQGEEVYFRYVWAAPRGGPPAASTFELLRLFVALSQALGPAVEAVAEGSITPDQLPELLG